jgi:hypothetical protein
MNDYESSLSPRDHQYGLGTQRVQETRLTRLPNEARGPMAQIVKTTALPSFQTHMDQ